MSVAAYCEDVAAMRKSGSGKIVVRSRPGNGAPFGACFQSRDSEGSGTHDDLSPIPGDSKKAPAPRDVLGGSE